MYALKGMKDTHEAAYEKMSWTDFRKAVRSDAICAKTARHLFRTNFSKLGDICRREGCSIEKARTINAALEGEVTAALLRAGLPMRGKAYNSVDLLLKDLKS